MQKFAGVAGGVVWLRLSSRSLLDRDLFQFSAMQGHQPAHHPRPGPEGAFDKTRSAPDAGLKPEGFGLFLLERAHCLEAPDRGAGRLHGLEAKGRPDQALESAMAGLDDVVEVFHLPVIRFDRPLSFFLQFANGLAAASRLDKSLVEVAQKRVEDLLNKMGGVPDQTHMKFFGRRRGSQNPEGGRSPTGGF